LGGRQKKKKQVGKKKKKKKTATAVSSLGGRKKNRDRLAPHVTATSKKRKGSKFLPGFLAKYLERGEKRTPSSSYPKEEKKGETIVFSVAPGERVQRVSSCLNYERERKDAPFYAPPVLSGQG